MERAEAEAILDGDRETAVGLLVRLDQLVKPKQQTDRRLTITIQDRLRLGPLHPRQLRRNTAGPCAAAERLPGSHWPPNTAGPCGWSCRLATSGRAPSGCAASSCSPPTSPASGSGTATTTTRTSGKRRGMASSSSL